MGRREDYAQLEDQAEWERCRSYQRMFLALHDEGRGMEEVAERLVSLLESYRAESCYTGLARDAIFNGLADTEQARPVYMAFVYASKAIDDKGDPPPPPGGGSWVVCREIRRIYPMAPEGFRKVGKLEGRPAEQGAPACALPWKLLGVELAPDKDLLT